jgi:hypothetical protein
MRFRLFEVAFFACTAFPALVCAPAVVGCGSSTPAPRPLPAYTGRGSALFDDSIAPDAVGVQLDRDRNPRTDAMLRERAQLADAALRVRIATITAREDGESSSYDLTMQTVERIAGANPPPETFTVRITPESESFPLVRGRQERLVGLRFVAIVRAFVRPDGDEELHFRLEPDDPDVIAAVRDATSSAATAKR